MVSAFLHVQICTYGREGLARVVCHRHPHIEGVRWLVSVQTGGESVEIPAEISSRDDFDVVLWNDKGLSRNRNNAMRFECDSPFVLIADDDVDYNEDGLSRLMTEMKNNPETEIFFSRYRNNGQYVKPYGNGEPYGIARPPRGWFPSSVEVSFRREAFVPFNERFGAGSGEFIAGEEALWLHQMLKAGHRGVLLPIDLCEHNQDSTSARLRTTQQFQQAQGAVLRAVKPRTWRIRAVVNSIRTPMPFFKCLKYNLQGARKYSSKNT